MNSTTLSGKLTKDAESWLLSNCDGVVSFGVADNEGRDRATILEIAPFSVSAANRWLQYLTKGQPVSVICSVSEREWTDNEGIKRKNGRAANGYCPARKSQGWSYANDCQEVEFDRGDVPFSCDRVLVKR